MPNGTVNTSTKQNKQPTSPSILPLHSAPSQAELEKKSDKEIARIDRPARRTDQLHEEEDVDDGDDETSPELIYTPTTSNASSPALSSSSPTMLSSSLVSPPTSPNPARIKPSYTVISFDRLRADPDSAIRADVAAVDDRLRRNLSYAGL